MILNSKETAMDVGVKVTIGGILLGWIGTIGGWAVMIFRSGRAYGTLKTRVSVNEGEISELKTNTAKELEKVHKSVEKLLRCFTTLDGEPRLVSFPALDKTLGSCRKETDIRLDGHDDVLEKHDKKLDTIIEGVATLNGKRENGHGQD